MNRREKVAIIRNLVRYPAAIIKVYGIMLGVAGIVMGSLGLSPNPLGTLFKGFTIWFGGFILEDLATAYGMINRPKVEDR